MKNLTKYDTYFKSQRVQKSIRSIPLLNQNFSLFNYSPFSIFWYSIDWRKCDKVLKRIQHLIFMNPNHCRQMQNNLLNLSILKIWSLRSVCFNIYGRRCAGIDRLGRLTHSEAVLISSSLIFEDKLSTKRFIPKSNSVYFLEPRFKLPIVKDRVKQKIVKFVVEPQWESKFDSKVFGFRPGMSHHDCILCIKRTLKEGGKYVYFLNVEKCFRRLDFSYLIRKLDFFEFDIVAIYIKFWLVNNIMHSHNKLTFELDSEFVQIGILSPLIYNIFLHGLNIKIIDSISYGRLIMFNHYKFDFYTYVYLLLLITQNKRDLFLCINAIDEFLVSIGLDINLKEMKKIHTLNKSISYTINMIDRLDICGRYVLKKEKVYLPLIYGDNDLLLITNSFHFLRFNFRCFLRVSKNYFKSSYRINVSAFPSDQSIRRDFAMIRKGIRR